MDLTARGRVRDKDNSKSHEVDIPIEDFEDAIKKDDETPRINTQPKEQLTINISIMLCTIFYIIFILFALMWNLEHYEGFFFGRLT